MPRSPQARLLGAVKLFLASIARNNFRVILDVGQQVLRQPPSGFVREAMARNIWDEMCGIRFAGSPQSDTLDALQQQLNAAEISSSVASWEGIEQEESELSEAFHPSIVEMKKEDYIDEVLRRDDIKQQFRVDRELRRLDMEAEERAESLARERSQELSRQSLRNNAREERRRQFMERREATQIAILQLKAKREQDAAQKKKLEDAAKLAEELRAFNRDEIARLYDEKDEAVMKVLQEQPLTTATVERRPLQETRKSWNGVFIEKNKKENESPQAVPPRRIICNRENGIMQRRDEIRPKAKKVLRTQTEFMAQVAPPQARTAPLQEIQNTPKSVASGKEVRADGEQPVVAIDHTIAKRARRKRVNEGTTDDTKALKDSAEEKILQAQITAKEPEDEVPPIIPLTLANISCDVDKKEQDTELSEGASISRAMTGTRHIHNGTPVHDDAVLNEKEEIQARAEKADAIFQEFQASSCRTHPDPSLLTLTLSRTAGGEGKSRPEKEIQVTTNYLARKREKRGKKRNKKRSKKRRRRSLPTQEKTANDPDQEPVPGDAEIESEATAEKAGIVKRAFGLIRSLLNSAHSQPSAAPEEPEPINDNQDIAKDLAVAKDIKEKDKQRLRAAETSGAKLERQQRALKDKADREERARRAFDARRALEAQKAARTVKGRPMLEVQNIGIRRGGVEGKNESGKWQVNGGKDGAVRHAHEQLRTGEKCKPATKATTPETVKEVIHAVPAPVPPRVPPPPENQSSLPIHDSTKITKVVEEKPFPAPAKIVIEEKQESVQDRGERERIALRKDRWARIPGLLEARVRKVEAYRELQDGVKDFESNIETNNDARNLPPSHGKRGRDQEQGVGRDDGETTAKRRKEEAIKKTLRSHISASSAAVQALMEKRSVLRVDGSGRKKSEKGIKIFPGKPEASKDGSFDEVKDEVETTVEVEDVGGVGEEAEAQIIASIPEADVLPETPLIAPVHNNEEAKRPQEEQLEQAWATQWAASLAFQREIDAIAEGCEAIGRAFQAQIDKAVRETVAGPLGGEGKREMVDRLEREREGCVEELRGLVGRFGNAGDRDNETAEELDLAREGEEQVPEPAVLLAKSNDTADYEIRVAESSTTKTITEPPCPTTKQPPSTSHQNSKTLPLPPSTNTANENLFPANQSAASATEQHILLQGAVDAERQVEEEIQDEDFKRWKLLHVKLLVDEGGKDGGDGEAGWEVVKTTKKKKKSRRARHWRVNRKLKNVSGSLGRDGVKEGQEEEDDEEDIVAPIRRKRRSEMAPARSEREPESNREPHGPYSVVVLSDD